MVKPERLLYLSTLFLTPAPKQVLRCRTGNTMHCFPLGTSVSRYNGTRRHMRSTGERYGDVIFKTLSCGNPLFHYCWLYFSSLSVGRSSGERVQQTITWFWGCIPIVLTKVSNTAPACLIQLLHVHGIYSLPKVILVRVSVFYKH